jgi:hypothetical protein
MDQNYADNNRSDYGILYVVITELMSGFDESFYLRIWKKGGKGN